jgi:hypothetical protein
MATTSVFNFPNHIVVEQYPDPGTSITLGNSYTFATPPTAPDQRIFVLSFNSMWRGLGADGTKDIVSNPQNNLGLLLDFYENYKLHKTFQYPHPWLGTLNVRFNKPLSTPKGIAGGDGWTEGFDIEFKEQP